MTVTKADTSGLSLQVFLAAVCSGVGVLRFYPGAVLSQLADMTDHTMGSTHLPLCCPGDGFRHKANARPGSSES